MLVLLALLGALILGIVGGLAFRGFIMIGDQRQIEIKTQQMLAESRVAAATRQAIGDMRRVAADQFRNRSASE